MNKNKMTQHSTSLMFSLIISVVLFSCSTNKVAVRKEKTTQNIIEVNTDNTITAQQYLSQAKNASSNESIALLISASQKLIEEHQLAKSLWLAEQTLPLVLNDLQKKHLLLIKAESLFLSENIELALTALQAIEGIESLSKIHQLKYYQLIALVQSNRGLNLAAANANLRVFSLKNTSSIDETKTQWLELNNLSQWEIDQLASMNPPNFLGWQQLLNFAHRFGYDVTSFRRYLTQWQRQFPQHPGNYLIPELLSDKLNLANVQQNIAVILPLTGSQKAAGESAQQGILSAYNNDESKKLHFIDSNNVDMATLNEQFSQLQINYVIGPLLKSKVDEYLAQQELMQPTLLFNTPIKETLQEQHIVLSMNPADEAIQAATTLSRKSYKHPIIFSQKDGVSKRIAETFSNQWHKITGNIPETIYVNGGAKMQSELKDSLDVSSSQSRINNIDKRIRQKIKTEARNRRDLDMIYVVGSPNETRLLKPYIDVNISPFARKIPIFASSRSHSDNADKSDSRDLTGLQFTEMPWLLSSKQQNQSLKKLNETIWPNRSDSLQRIFAMGYDSLSLIEKFQMFKQYPYIRHYGQTGILKLKDNTVLTRSLLWGNYQKDKVQEIVMEQQK
ncbi:MAG: penicillin-binding protein activator [Colwelliaceae bacterium]|nr:penicillin-binding protein activator [Colwelliaceae bacterium]